MKKSAFSLVEVLILFTVMSVIMAASLPTISKKSNAIPLKLQQGAYYCIANDDGTTYREMQYVKGNLKHDNRNAASCTFNPPARAAVFKITLIGAGAGGYDEVRVINDTSHNPQVTDYFLDKKYSNNLVQYKKFTPKELWQLFAGEKISLYSRVPHGGKGSTVKTEVPHGNQGTCYCPDYPTPCATYDSVTEAACGALAAGRQHKWIADNVIKKGVGGIGGGYSSDGKDLSVHATYKIPANPKRLKNNNYEQLMTLVASLSKFGSCLNCEKMGVSVNGYSGIVNGGTGKMQDGADSSYTENSPFNCINQSKPCSKNKGGDAQGSAYVVVPNDGLNGGVICRSMDTARGGQSGSVDASLNVHNGQAGSYNRESCVVDGVGSNFIPKLVFRTNLTRRQYLLGDWGKDGDYLHFMKYSLQGPCQVTPGHGGPAYNGDHEMYPSSEDLKTTIACRGFEKSVLGGHPRESFSPKYDQYSGGPATIPIKTVYADKPETDEPNNDYQTPYEKMMNIMFFKLYNPNLFIHVGEGGGGAGFVDKCTGNSDEAPEDTNRYSGDFSAWIGNALNENEAPTTRKKFIEIKSTCIDTSQNEDNKYGTVNGKYELKPAQPGHGGAVIITW